MGRIVQTFTDFGNRKWKDRLHGGKADDKVPEDFDPDDVAIGTKVEREHTDNPDIATEVALDHLEENPEYYDELIASGIADEEEAIDLFDKLKGKNAREKARKDIEDFMEEEDDNDDEEYDDEDDLGTDLADIDDDEEQIFDEDELKNKKRVMEKSNTLKKYNSFVNEQEDNDIPIPAEPGPERKFSKENKYKFQMPYDKKIAEKLSQYHFVPFVPEGETAGVPKKGTHFIIIDILNLNYSIVLGEKDEIRTIEPSKLKNILENL